MVRDELLIRKMKIMDKEVILNNHPRIARVVHMYDGDPDSHDILSKFIMDYLKRTKQLD